VSFKTRMEDLVRHADHRFGAESEPGDGGEHSEVADWVVNWGVAVYILAIAAGDRSGADLHAGQNMLYLLTKQKQNNRQNVIFKTATNHALHFPPPMFIVHERPSLSPPILAEADCGPPTPELLLWLLLLLSFITPKQSAHEHIHKWKKNAWRDANTARWL